MALRTMILLVSCLLFFFLPHILAASPLCTAVNFHTGATTFPAQPIDGLGGGTALWAYVGSWASTACAQQEAGGSLNAADADWQSTTLLQLSGEFARRQGLAASNGRLRRSIVAHISADGRQLDLLNVTLQFRLDVTESGVSGSADVLGTLTKTVTGVPVDAATYLPVGWYGSLQRKMGGLVLADADLFDGTDPAVTVTTTVDAIQLLEVAETMREVVGNAALRHVLYDTVPSTLGEVTVRGAFLSNSVLPPLSLNDAAVGQVWTPTSSGDFSTPATGVVMQSRAECLGSTCSSHSFVGELKKLVTASLSNSRLCTNVVPVATSLRASLSVDLAVMYSPSAPGDVTRAFIRARGMSARSEGLFQCTINSGGSAYIGIVLAVAAPLNESAASWPLHALTTSQRTIVGLLQAIPMCVSGKMSGRIAVSSQQVYTIASSDLFSARGGGRLLADQPLPSTANLKTTVTALFAAIRSRLGTSISSIDSAVAKIFPADSSYVDQLITEYTAQRSQFSFLDFLQYWYTVRGGDQLQLLINDSAVALSVEVTVSRKTPSSSDNNALVLSKANSAIQSLANAIKSRFPAADSYSVPSIQPDLSNVDLANSYISGFLSASLTLNITAVLANDMVSALTVVQSPRVMAIASIRGRFAGSWIISSADITYDFNQTLNANSALIQATLASGLQGSVGRMAGLSLEGTLAIDGTWVNPSLMAPAFLNIASSIGEARWARQVLQPFTNVDLGRMSARARLADMAAALASIPATTSTQSTTGWAYAQAIREAIMGFTAGDPTIAAYVHIVPIVSPDLPSAQTLDVTVIVHSLRRAQIGSTGTTWDSSIDTARMTIPLALTTRLRFTVSPATAQPSTFAVTGAGALYGWTIPFTWRMLAGPAAGSVASIAINLPSGSADLLVSMDVTTNQMQLTAQVSDNLVDESSPAILVVTRRDTNTDASLGTPTITASRILSALGEAILPALPQAFSNSLNIQVSPLKQTLGTISTQHFNQFIGSVKPWLSTFSTPASATALLVESETFCVGSPAAVLSFNITVNDLGTKQCTSPTAIAPSSVNELRTDIHNVLIACELNDWLDVQVVDAYTATGQQCGHVGILPAVPGIVYNFAILTGENSGNVSLNSQWQSNPKPIFPTWPDLSSVLSTVMGRPDSHDLSWQWTTANASLVVPNELADYFPEQLPAMAVRLHASQTSIDQRLEFETRISAEGGAVEMKADVDVGTGSISAELYGTMVTVFGGPPMGGLGNISLSTNFDGSLTTVNTTLVPQAPNNTFVLVIGAELVSKSALGRPQWLGTTQTIQLTPGKLLARALIEDVLEQLDATYRPMVSIYEVPADDLINPVSQIRFDLVPHQSGEQWLLPASFGFRVTSGLPAINNAANVPTQSFIFVRDLSMGIATYVEAAQFDSRGRLRTTTSAEGRVGILSFQSTSHQARSSIKVLVQGLSSYQTLAQLYPSRDQFFQQFAVNLALNNSAEVTGLQMRDVQKVATDLPGVIFSQVRQYVVRGFDELRNLTQREMNDWRALFNGTSQAIQTFQNLIKTNNTICTWMGLANNVSQAIVTSAVASKKIPFSKNTFGSLLSDSLVTSIKDINTAVCVNGEALSLFSYCRTVNKGFFGSNTTTCANASLSASGVTVDLVVTPFNRSYADQLQLDTGSLFGDSLPVGIGATGDLSLMGRFDFKMRLQALFNDGRVTLRLDPDGTYFIAQASFDARGTLRFYFGSISLNLVSAHAWLGHPAAFIVRLLPPSDSSALSLTYEEDASTAIVVPEFSTSYGYSSMATQQGRISILGDAGFVGVIGFDPTVQCMLNVSIPDLQAFLTGTKATVSQTGCGKGFAQELLRKLLSSSLLEFFSTRFLSQWEAGFSDFLTRLFGKAGQMRGSAAVLPLIGRLLSAVVIDSISSLNGADSMKRLTSAMNNVTTTVLGMNVTEKQEILDQIVLNLFTDALCRELTKTKVLPECPSPPKATDPEYIWPFHFRGTKSRSLGDLGFSLGRNGFASLELSCSGALEMEWDLVMVMAFNRTHGLSFRFETSPVFDAKIGLKVSDNCGLTGTIGWIGADLKIKQPQLLAGQLTVDNTFFVDLSVKAQILGEAQLGLGGKLAERLAKSKDALDALPHWQATLNLTWDWDIHTNRNLVPHFALTDITFCIGRLLSNTIGTTVAQTVDRFMKPLDPVLGKDGLLLKPIPGLSDVFGSDLNVIQLLNYACKVEGHCELKDVVKTLETFLDIYRTLDLVRTITKALDGEGCNVVQLVRNFTVDFRQKHPAVEYTGPPLPSGSLSWADPNESPQLKETVTTFWRGMNKTGSFGVRLYLFDNLGQTLVNAMLGQDFPIVGVTLPDFVFFIGMEWHIPVFVFPRVDLVLGVYAQLSVRFGGVSLMYSGLAQAYKTKSPGAIFGALALPTKYDDGSERWPVQASVGFKGGVSVSILIFKGEVYLTVALEGDAAFVDIDSDGWVTFNELFYLVKRNGLAGSIRLRLQLKAGFGIKIQACINLIFKKKCWTFFDKKWEKSWPLYDNSRKIFASIASEQSQVNLDMVSFDAGTGEAVASDCEGCIAPLSHIKRADDGSDLTYNIYETPDGLTVDFNPAGVGVSSGTPHLMRSNLPTTKPITATGNPGSVPFTWSIGYVSQIVEFPNYPSATLRFLVGQYSETADVDVVNITPQSVAPDSAPGVQLSTCSQLHLAEPTTGVTYAVTGVPCPALIESMATNNVSLTGPASLYTGRSVTLEGEAWVVSSSIPATEYTISSSSLVGVDGQQTANILMPLTYRVLEVTGDLQRSSTYTIADVGSGVTATVTGGQNDDLFVVQGMHLLQGSTHLVGGSGVDLAEITIEVQPDLGDMEVTVAPTWLLVKNGMGASQSLISRFDDDLDDGLNNTHSLRHTSIERRTYYLKGASNARAKVTMLPTDRDDSVIIVAQNAVGGTIAQQITGCNGKSEVRYRFEGGGTHELRIGNQRTVSDMRCTVWLDGASNDVEQLVSVVVEAAAEDRPLQYDVQRNAILIYDVLGDGNYFHLMFDEIQRIHIQFGTGGSVLRMDEGTTGTEFFFEFPQNASVTNMARVTSTNRAVLLAGHITEIDIGPVETAIYTVNPLDSLLAPVVIAQTPSATGNPTGASTAALVRLASGTGRDAPAQHYFLNQQCVAKRDFDIDGGRAPVHVQTAPTEWLCGLMTSYGLPSAVCSSPCPVIYNGPINVTIKTGWADDSFYGVDVDAASVAVSLGQGADNITWLTVQESAANNYATARFDLGPGTDSLTVSAPVRNVTTMLGSDTDVDMITFFWGDMPLPPHVYGDTMQPVGPFDSSMKLRQVEKQDLLFIYGGKAPALAETSLNRPELTVNEVVRSQDWLSHYERQGDRPIITVNITVTSTVVMDVPSTVIYDIVGAAMQATVSLNGQGREEPPHPPAFDWDTILNVPSTSGLLVNVWTLPQSRTASTINIQGSPSDGIQSVSIGSPDEICRVLYGKVEVRTSNVNHLKIASDARPIAVEVSGTAGQDLVIRAPDGPASVPSTVRLSQVQNSTLVTNALLAVTPLALMANRTIIITGNRSQLSFTDGYAFDSGVAYIDGCLLGNNFRPLSQAFSPWFTSALEETKINAGAVQDCSVYTQQLASVDLISPSISARGLGSQQATRQLNLRAIKTHVMLNETEGLVWTEAAVFNGTLTVTNRNLVINLEFGGNLTVMSPVLDMANVSVVDVFASPLDGPEMVWYFGQPPRPLANQTSEDKLSLLKSGATLISGDPLQQVQIHGGVLVTHRHLPLLRLHGSLTLLAIMHNATNATVRDITINSTWVQSYELPATPLNHTAPERAIDTATYAPLFAVGWTGESRDGLLTMDFNDGDNKIHLIVPTVGENRPENPILVVRKNASLALSPLSTRSGSSTSVSLMQTTGLRVELPGQFLKPLMTDDQVAYCYQPYEQSDRNTWLWITTRQAPWLESDLPCRLDDEVHDCDQNIVVDMLVDSDHRLLTDFDPPAPPTVNSSATGELQLYLPYILHVTNNPAQHDVGNAPSEWDIGVAVLVVASVITVLTFGWWIFTGVIAPSPFGPFLITAALAGLVRSSTTWHPRVIALVQAAHWMVASVITTDSGNCAPFTPSIFHLCLMSVFLLTCIIVLGLLFFHERIRYATLIRRAVLTVILLAVPFIIIQAPAHSDIDSGWPVLTTFLGLAIIFVLASFVLHTFAALPVLSRRIMSLMPSLLLVLVVIWMPLFIRLSDLNLMPRAVLYGAIIAAVVVDSAASLSAMIVRSSLVRSWWRISPSVITAITCVVSTGCGLTFVCTLELGSGGSGGELWMVTWFVWALLPALASSLVYLPLPSISKSSSDKVEVTGFDVNPLGLSLQESKRPLLKDDESVGYKAPVIVGHAINDDGVDSDESRPL